ncbi:MAG TPA: hypothetical protein PKH39_05965 [Woeseiaceae bacterium]|nr:hypothetical protein [Woeseiaceae bacterium]
MVQRIFYVTQGSLRVWLPGAAGKRAAVKFSDDDRGLRDFDRYLSLYPDMTSAMLFDVIEEEFALDSIPKLGLRDRTALIQRRGQRKFRRTPYRVSIYQGTPGRKENEFNVVHSAISNHELVDPWIQLILDHKTPMCGVYSVPLMTPRIVRRLFSCDDAVMFVAPHQGTKLRQVFLRDGAIQSARLSQGPGIDDDGFAKFVVTEVVRSRRYLDRTRLISNMETLKVCVIASEETADRIRSLVDSNSTDHYRFLTPKAATRKLGRRQLHAADHFEEIFLSAAAKRQPKHSYANAGEDRYWKMRRLRGAIIGSAFVTAAACSVVAAVLLSDVWGLRNRIAAIQSQVEFLAETYRRENDRFDPIKADSHEMQLAVDTGDYLLANRVPVPWVMNHLGAVLGDYPDIKLQGLNWLAETPPDPNPRPQRRDVMMPVSVPVTSGVSAVITADIEPFDGNMRHAFARIDALAADIERRTRFDRADAIEYPFDANTSSAVSGEILSRQGNQTATFRLRVYYALPDAGEQGRDTDESI